VLTRAILPGMVARKRGGILNVASIVAFQAIPYWTTYAATKAFVLSFGEGLAYELRKSGVRVVTVCPGFTKTGLYAKSGVPGLAGKLLPFATPEEVVRVALAAYDAGRVIRIVGATNRLLTLSAALTPRFILRSHRSGRRSRLRGRLHSAPARSVSESVRCYVRLPQ